jgi:hypothetical protein
LSGAGFDEIAAAVSVARLAAMRFTPSLRPLKVNYFDHVPGNMIQIKVCGVPSAGFDLPQFGSGPRTYALAD